MIRTLHIALPMVLFASLSLPVWGADVEPDLGTEEQREAGKALYDQYCSQCHGVDGDGNGYAAPYMQPRPRDLTAGRFKLRTTPSGALPTDDDLIKVIREGMPYTTMIGWPDFADHEVKNIIYYIKTFSPSFEDPDFYDPPITISEPPAFSEESATLGRKAYERMECGSCHGDKGRADGPSAPTLKDDSEYPIRSANLTKRWTYRGGPTRKDIYRTFSTGMNGTPMPSYVESLTEDERWQLVDYVYSLGAGDEPAYSDRLIAKHVEQDIALGEGEAFEALTALFDPAEGAHFPVVGQVMEPGREFQPPANGIEVKAIYNRDDVAFLVKWHDMRPDIAGSNDPAMEVERVETQPPGEPSTGRETSADSDDFFGEVSGAQDETSEADDFFGGATEDETTDDDFFGGATEDENSGDDFFAADDDAETEAAPETSDVQESAYSDAVAIQFPSALPDGIRLPYFIFGDLENSVDLWFADLAQEKAQRYVGRGSSSLTEGDAGDLAVETHFADGEWTVVFKQKRRSERGISFEESQWTPVAFSVWDGWSQERGNRRGLTSWFYVYAEPSKAVSPVWPMTRAALIVFGLELIAIVLIRRRPGQGAFISKEVKV
jgi:mono/diheme cytochrome c family protein